MSSASGLRNIASNIVTQTIKKPAMGRANRCILTGRSSGYRGITVTGATDGTDAKSPFVS